MHSVNLRSFGLLRNFRWYCKPKRVFKIGDSGKPPDASAAGEIPGHCLSNLVICRRQYGPECAVRLSALQDLVTEEQSPAFSDARLDCNYSPVKVRLAPGPAAAQRRL
jgi:hypothetical protein